MKDADLKYILIRSLNLTTTSIDIWTKISYYFVIPCKVLHLNLQQQKIWEGFDIKPKK